MIHFRSTGHTQSCKSVIRWRVVQWP